MAGCALENEREAITHTAWHLNTECGCLSSILLTRNGFHVYLLGVGEALVVCLEHLPACSSISARCKTSTSEGSVRFSSAEPRASCHRCAIRKCRLSTCRASTPAKHCDRHGDRHRDGQDLLVGLNCIILLDRLLDGSHCSLSVSACHHLCRQWSHTKNLPNCSLVHTGGASWGSPSNCNIVGGGTCKTHPRLSSV